MSLTIYGRVGEYELRYMAGLESMSYDIWQGWSSGLARQYMAGLEQWVSLTIYGRVGEYELFTVTPIIGFHRFKTSNSSLT